VVAGEVSPPGGQQVGAGRGLAGERIAHQRPGVARGVEWTSLAMLVVGIVEPEEVEETPVKQRSLRFVDLATVLDEPVERLLEVLKTAIANGLVPVALHSQLDIIKERFAELV
jgi:hypothetical protein